MLFLHDDKDRARRINADNDVSLLNYKVWASFLNLQRDLQQSYIVFTGVVALACFPDKKGKTHWL